MRIRSESGRGAMFAAARKAVAVLCVGATTIIVGHSVSGQSPATDRAEVIPQPPLDTSAKPWTGQRTPDGQPDIQGYWRSLNGGTRSVENPPPLWFAPGFPGTADGPRMTDVPSRIVDPPDGRIPLQPWALARVQQQTTDLDNPTQPWHLDPQNRCIQGPPRWQYYVSDFRITQAPGMVVITYVSYHMFRVIRLDTKEHLIAPDVKLWYGDSIGHWDGNTLNVDLANLNGKIRVTMRGDFVTDDVQIQERFVVMGPGSIMWEQTITDPKVYSRPFTMRVPLGQEGFMYLSPTNEIWEYDCWESQEVRPSLMPAHNPGRPQGQP